MPNSDNFLTECNNTHFQHKTMFDRLKYAVRTVVNIPIGLYYILIGVSLLAFWGPPAKLGSEFAQQFPPEARKLITEGKTRMAP